MWLYWINEFWNRNCTHRENYIPDNFDTVSSSAGRCCDYTSSSYNTHQGQLFQELALVTQLQYTSSYSQVIQKRLFSHSFIFKNKTRCFLLMSASMLYVNLSTRQKRCPTSVTNITMVYAHLPATLWLCQLLYTPLCFHWKHDVIFLIFHILWKY